MRILSLFLFVSLLSTPVGAKTLTDKNIKDFLQNNPSIILDVLREHSTEVFQIVVDGSEEESKRELEEQRTTLLKSLDKERNKKPYNVLTKNRLLIGSSKASLSFVAYSDFLCPYCAHSAESIAELLSKNKDINYLFKVYSRNPLGQKAYAYYLALGAKNKEKALIFYKTLFENQKTLIQEKEAYLKHVVQGLGYKPNEIEDIAQSPLIQNIVNEDIAEGKALNIQGTPTLLINGKYTIIGAIPTEILEDITEYIKKKP